MAAPTLTAITTPQNNGSNTLAVNMPGSVVSSDLLICVLSHGGTNVNMPGTTPWTKKIENSNSIAVAYIRGTAHISNGSPATYSFTTGGVSAITNAYVIQLAGAISTGDPFDNLVTGATTAVTSSAALSFTTATVDVYLHNADFKSAARTLSTPPTGMTQRAGGAGNSFQHAFDSTQGATGGTGTKTSVYTVGSSHSSVLFAVKPATSQTVSPSGIASTATVGSPTVIRDQFISPGGIASTATVGTPTVIRDQFVSPPSIPSGSTVGTPTLIQDQFISPAGIPSGSTVGSPTLLQQQIVQPSSIAPTSAVGTPTLVPDQLIEPPSIGPGSTVGTPTLHATITVQPVGIGSTSSVGTPMVFNGLVIIPDGIDPTSSVGTPTILRELLVEGVVFNHETGDPVGAGVVVKLFNQDDVLIDTTTTAPDGSYFFYLPSPQTDTFWTLANYMVGPVQYHGVSDRGCAAL